MKVAVLNHDLQRIILGQGLFQLMQPTIHHIHEPHQKPILAWFDNRLFLTDPQQQKILCELQIRTHHNGRKLLSPEIALPAINEKGEAA